MVTVAIIDSGIRMDLLSHNVECIKVNLFDDKCDDEIVQGLHGTICAEVLLQRFHDVKIIDIPIFECADTLSCEYLKLEQALQWCSKNFVEIINMSFTTQRTF